MSNLAIVKYESKSTRYYKATTKILKGIAGAYMFVVGGALRFVFSHKTEVLCGVASAWLVQLAMR